MKNKKNLTKNTYLNSIKIFFVLSLVLVIANPVKALSFKSFFTEALGLSSATNTLENSQREENVQTLKVFESDKTVTQSSLENNMPAPDLDNDNMTLEPGKENFSENEETETHGDNAIYVVQKGDSIYSIAAYFEVSVDTILSFNKKKNKIVTVGEILEVPGEPGVLYEVKKGDTLLTISKKYSVDLDDVTLYNGLLATDTLSPGDEVFLPGAVEKVSVTTSKKTKGSIANVAGSKIAKNETGLLSKYKPKTWAKGDTSHLNSLSDIKRYSSLPKYPGYYLYPAPGTSRTQKMHGHNGADLAGKMGTPILASAGGVVRVAKSSGYNFGYGNYVIVTHDNGSETVYAHMSGVTVSPGQRVSQGQQVGTLGSTGNSTGPHLHFEIRGAYNPWAW